MECEDLDHASIPPCMCLSFLSHFFVASLALFRFWRVSGTINYKIIYSIRQFIFQLHFFKGQLINLRGGVRDETLCSWDLLGSSQQHWALWTVLGFFSLLPWEVKEWED